MATLTFWRTPASVTRPPGTATSRSAAAATPPTPGAVLLVRPLPEHPVEHLAGDRDEVRVGDPRAVEPVARLALLVLAHPGQRVRRDLGLAAVRDERRHPADRVGAAAVAGGDEEAGVSAHERDGHRHLPSVRQDERGLLAEALDEAEHVVPAAGVQARGVLAELEQDLVHLERREDRLDEHGRPDAAAGDAGRGLGVDEDVVPEAGLEVALELRQVEVRAGAAASASAALWNR